MAERVDERVGERVGERMGERVGERVGEGAAASISSRGERGCQLWHAMAGEDALCRAWRHQGRPQAASGSTFPLLAVGSRCVLQMARVHHGELQNA